MSPSAALSAYLEDVVNEADMSDRISLLHQDLLQMLHLKTHTNESFWQHLASTCGANV